MLFLPPLVSLLVLVATAWDHHKSPSGATASNSVAMPLDLKSVSPVALPTADGELALDSTSNAIIKYSLLNHYDPFAFQTCYGIPTIGAHIATHCFNNEDDLISHDAMSGAFQKISDNSFALSAFWFIKTDSIFKELSCPLWLVALVTILILYSIVRLCRDLSKIFTKQMLCAALAKYNAARDAASTVQGPTRGATVSGSDISEDTILCHDDEIPTGVPKSCLRTYQIDFLCQVLSLSEWGAFMLVEGREGGIGMRISDAIVFSYDRFFSKLDLGLDGDLLHRLPPNIDPETFRQIHIITKPSTVCRLVEHLASQLIFDAAENIPLPCAQETISRVRDTAAKAVFYFMSFSRPLVKVALVLRALILLSDIVESRTIHPLHVRVLKSLMRDVHGELPTDEDKEVIQPLLIILMELERLLTKNKNKPVTTKTVVFSTAKKGAKTIVDWTKDFMASVASKDVDASPPAA
jgi:hypothetical protein